MPDGRFTAINDHVAVRVESIERATAFYRAAFGAQVLTEPFDVEGELAAGIVGASAGTRLRMRQIGFDQGVMELVEVTPAAPTGARPGTELNILHIGVQVDNVKAALRAVEAAGGRVVVREFSWGDARICFCTDPDGTVLELADASIQELLRHTRALSSSDHAGGIETP